MQSKYIVLLSAIVLTLNSLTSGEPSNSWAAYSDTSSFRDVLQGRTFEETFGSEQAYDSLYGSSIGGQYSGSSSPTYESQPQTNNIQVIQQRSDSNYGSSTGGQRYNSPAVQVRSGQKSGGGGGYGGTTQSSFAGQGFKGVSQKSYGSGGSSGSSGGYGSGSDDGHHGGDDEDHSKWLDVFGKPGQDFPVYNEVPDTGFSCKNQQYPGYYADTEAQCQAFYICQADGRQDGFLCPNATLFNQQTFVCEWYYNVDCSLAQSLYNLNAELYRETGSSGSADSVGSGGYGGGQTSYGSGGEVGGRTSGGYGGGSGGKTSKGSSFGGFGGSSASAKGGSNYGRSGSKSSYDGSSSRKSVPPPPARAFTQQRTIPISSHQIQIY